MFNYAVAEAPRGVVIEFPQPPQTKKKPPNNAKKGGYQTVYPLKKKGEIAAVAKWLHENRDPKYLLAFTMGINLGLRANELLGLKTQDVFWPDGSVRKTEDKQDVTDGCTIFQSKNKKNRKVFLNDACVKALETCFPARSKETYDQGWLFPSRKGDGPLGVGALRHVLKEACDACGITQNIGSHTLRKTFGYWHYMQNQDIVCLQRLFGHSSPGITLRYIGITDEDDKMAYNAVSIDVFGSLDET